MAEDSYTDSLRSQLQSAHAKIARLTAELAQAREDRDDWARRCAGENKNLDRATESFMRETMNSDAQLAAATQRAEAAEVACGALRNLLARASVVLAATMRCPQAGERRALRTQLQGEVVAILTAPNVGAATMRELEALRELERATHERSPSTLSTDQARALAAVAAARKAGG